MTSNDATLKAMLATIRSGAPYLMITEDGLFGTFPLDQVRSVLALALYAHAGHDHTTAAKSLAKAIAEHDAFAEAHPELKPN